MFGSSPAAGAKIEPTKVQDQSSWLVFFISVGFLISGKYTDLKAIGPLCGC